MNQLLKNVNELYKNLILTKEQGMIIFVLHRKVKDKEIPRHFSYRDIERAIREAYANEPGALPHTERILKVLLHYFIEHPPRQRNKFMLTDYAVKFIELIRDKLDSPYKRFPLRKTFEQYAQFKADSIENINDFRGWYERGFHKATKQTVLDHLDALKDEVNASINELNSILNQDFVKAIEIAERFTTVFNRIGEKTEEIKDTLRLENVLDQEIQVVVDMYYKRLESYKHPESETEKQEFNSIKNEYEEALLIKKSVSDFFLRVDERLAQLTEKALFASSQLKNLQNNFRNHSRFRIHLKRFLEFTLKEAAFTKDGPTLPEKFPSKSVPHEEFKFIHVPYYDSFITQQNEVIPAVIDDVYAKQENLKVERELLRQENSARLVKKYKNIIREQKELDFTDHFYKILRDEKDAEIALNVGFELFQFANSHPYYKVGIRKELPTEGNLENIWTWKMKILQKR